MHNLRYSIVLMDADETVFDFKKAEYVAFTETLKSFGYLCSDDEFQAYSNINLSLWKALESGSIDRPTLKTKRFDMWFEYMGISGISSSDFHNGYVHALSKCGFLIYGAEEFVKKLSTMCDIYILTNGLTASQIGRFQSSAIKDFVKGIYISESIGFSKPDKRYFDFCIKDIGEPDRSKYIMLGDSLSSDMLGGRNAGIATCRYVRDGKYEHSNLCDYEITDYNAFFEILKN